MPALIKSCTLLVLTLFGASAFAQGTGDATYSYTGPNFTDVTGSYTTANRVTGQFTTATPIGANGSLSDSSQVTGFSFSDGVQTLDDSNAIIVAFQATTGSNGNITTYGITVYGAPATSGPIDGIDIYWSPMGSEQDDGFVDAACSDFGGPGGTCQGLAIASAAESGFRTVFPSSASAPGTWMFVAGTPATPMVVPAMSPVGLLLLVLVLAGFATLVLRRRAVA